MRLNELLILCINYILKNDANPAPAEKGDGAGQETVVGEWDAAFLGRQNPGDLFELIVVRFKIKN